MGSKSGVLRALAGWVSNKPTPPEPEYDKLKREAALRYKDRPADQEMFDQTTNYLMEDKDRGMNDAELGGVLSGISKRFSNASSKGFKRHYPIQEIELNYDNIKTQYERSKASKLRQAEFWEEDYEKKRKAWEDYYETMSHDSPESIALREKIDRHDELPWSVRGSKDMLNKRDLMWDEYVARRKKTWEDHVAAKKILSEKMQYSRAKYFDYKYDQPRNLKAIPITEQDVRIYLGRIKDPEEKKYFTALVEDTKRQAAERKKLREDPKWKDPKLSNIAGSGTGVNPEVLEEIDRTNLSRAITDTPTRRYGFKPAWDSKNQRLTTIEDTASFYEHESDQDAYVYSSLLGRERFSPNAWIYQRAKEALRGGKAPTMYDSFVPDDMYSLLGQPRLHGVFMQNAPFIDRTEWDDTQTKSHELLHRYVRLAPFNKDHAFFGEGKNGDEEFFIRAYVKKINGEELDENFFRGLENLSWSGTYSNTVYDDDGRDKGSEEIELGKFRKALPSLIENFEKAVLGKEYIPASQIMEETLDDYELEPIVVTGKRTKEGAWQFEENLKSLESDHGSVPIPTNDEGEKNIPKHQRSLDIAYGHKIKKSEWKTGEIHGIKFVDVSGKYIPLTDEDKDFILQEDIKLSVREARQAGWDEKLKARGLRWEDLPDKYYYPLTDLAFNVGYETAQQWDAIFDDVKNDDDKSFVKNLRREGGAGQWTKGMDNRVAVVVYNAGLISSLKEAQAYGLVLADTYKIPYK